MAPLLPRTRHYWLAWSLLLTLALTSLGLLLVTDAPGLEAELFTFAPPWQGRPSSTSIGPPSFPAIPAIDGGVEKEILFSLRWRGYLAIREAGSHLFSLDADDGGYIRVDDRFVIDRRPSAGNQRRGGHADLDLGLHYIEIGYYQTAGRSRLAVRWRPPSQHELKPAPLPEDRLYAHWPWLPRRALRSALASWSRPYRQLLGAAILLAAALVLPGLLRSLSTSAAALKERWAARDGRRLRAALLVALFVVAFTASLPYTGTIRGGDDTTYLQVATFGEKAWFFNRYAHVYLLKAFVTLSGGDPFLGVRLWWSFTFAATVAALAVAVRSVGPGLQLRTLTVTLFVLLSQTTLLGMIGAGFADYSAMMFITAAVAIYMHDMSRTPRGPPRFEWHALALGASSLAAFRSKEVGAVLLLLPLLFLFEGGQLDLRRFAPRITCWLAGVAAVFLLLLLLDGLILGDFLFTLERARFEQSGEMNFPDQLSTRSERASWWRVVWLSAGHPASLALRYVWLGVVAAAIAAGASRQRIELRLLHLLPIAYLAALMLLYVRMTHPFSTRMLIPILPLASLMTGLLLHHAGLEKIPRRDLWSPRLLVPAGLAAAVVLFLVLPYRMQRSTAADLLPVDLLERYGWESELFLVGTLFPLLLLVALSLAALFVAHRRGRVISLLVAYLALFGLGLELNRTTLVQRRAQQRGELLRYPWRVFADELRAARPETVAFSRDLQMRYGMSPPTRSRIGSLALGRRNVHVRLARTLPKQADVAIASHASYERWLEEQPALATTARTDPGGLLVLVRPRVVFEQSEGSGSRQALPSELGNGRHERRRPARSQRRSASPPPRRSGLAGRRTARGRP